ncbi:unnamed protein product [Paramecium sonneborni]|uniref:Uncharacterized protein n=1 Tax=Paramecium sonneborni TaxID=65129 RepID=A0A8S1QSW2_9CILI|nr:unnamed protein product [Paramecium sonneborni]
MNNKSELSRANTMKSLNNNNQYSPKLFISQNTSIEQLFNKIIIPQSKSS